MEQKVTATEHKKTELKDIMNRGTMTRVEMNTLAQKLKHMRATIDEKQKQEEVKKQLSFDLENGISKAIINLDDYKSLKASLCSLSEQFLSESSKRRSRDTTSSNAEKLLALDQKISTMRGTIERKTNTHEKEMERLLREQIVLEKSIVL